MNRHVNAIAERLNLRPLDFVSERIWETKARGDMDSSEVAAKKESAVRWCRYASDYALTYNGKPWKYLLIPHDVISENMILGWLAEQFRA